MKIIDLDKFLAMPPGTVFAKFYPSVIGPPMVKAESLGANGELIDFRYTALTDGVDCFGSDEDLKILLAAQKDGTPFQLDFKILNRDGEFDPDQLFAVWERQDIEGLLMRLQEALAEGYGND